MNDSELERMVERENRAAIALIERDRNERRAVAWLYAFMALAAAVAFVAGGL